jgi:hypothetical protein
MILTECNQLGFGSVILAWIESQSEINQPNPGIRYMVEAGWYREVRPRPC